jgi:peptidoglycan/LPS O-acetylase OafA/YrhL
MIQSLEGIRGIAALLVALYHLGIGVEYFPVIRNGYLFVDLFFVLSGFVMCSAYGTSLKSASDLPSFLIRRIGRLFPLLVFSTIAFLAVANGIVLAKQLLVAYGHAGALNNPGALNYLVPSVAEILATLTFTHSLGLFDRLILNTPSWSISTEFYTYFVFAALCLAFRGRERLTAFVMLGLAGLLVSAWASVMLHDCLRQKGCLGLTYDFGFARCLYAFSLGVLAYYSSRRLRFNPVGLQITSSVALFLLFTLVDYAPVAAFAFPVAFAVLVLSICADTGPLADALKPSFFQMLGERSYSIYLMHMPLLLIFENLSKRANGLLSSSLVLVAYIAVLILISGWTYRHVEHPLRNVFRRLSTPRAGARRA